MLMHPETRNARAIRTKGQILIGIGLLFAMLAGGMMFNDEDFHMGFWTRAYLFATEKLDLDVNTTFYFSYFGCSKEITLGHVADLFTVIIVCFSGLLVICKAEDELSRLKRRRA